MVIACDFPASTQMSTSWSLPVPGPWLHVRCLILIFPLHSLVLWTFKTQTINPVNSIQCLSPGLPRTEQAPTVCLMPHSCLQVQEPQPMVPTVYNLYTRQTLMVFNLTLRWMICTMGMRVVNPDQPAENSPQKNHSHSRKRNSDSADRHSHHDRSRRSSSKGPDRRITGSLPGLHTRVGHRHS